MIIIGFFVILSNDHRSSLWPLAVFPLIFPAALYLGHAPLIFFWYLVPATWCFLVIAAMRMNELGTIVKGWAAKCMLPRYFPALSLLILFCVFDFVLLQSEIESVSYWSFWQQSEDGLRRVVGRYLRQNTPKNATVAMEAIGYQGYYSERYVIDLAGLVSPALVNFHRENSSNAQVFSMVLERLHPDYLILRSFEVDDNESYYGGPLFESTDKERYFFSMYTEEKRFSTPVPDAWGKASYLTLYKRKSAK